MSLNEVVRVDAKPWLNVRGNNVIIDGNISVQGGTAGYALCYHGPDDVKFSPLNNYQAVGFDQYYMTPIINAAPSKVTLVASPYASTNFTLAAGELTCVNTGRYLVSYKFEENNPTNNSYPNPYFTVNGSAVDTSSMRIPLCKTTSSTIPSGAGLQCSSLIPLTTGDVLVLAFATNPLGGTVTMVNQAGASNVTIIRLS